MRFFAVSRNDNEDNDKRIDFLEAACKARDVELVDLLVDDADFTDLPKTGKGDMVYQVDDNALILERLLINPKVATFYESFQRSLYQQWQLFDFIYHGIPIPKTIVHLTRDKSRLKEYVEYMGGFPVIIKALGKSHGAGVIRVDSFGGLFSVLDQFPKKRRIIMREFIDQNTHARLIVLGDKVVDSIEYVAQGDEFRTNVGDEPTVTPKKFSPEIEESAVKAVKALGLEFSGVDIMEDGKGNHYVIETNFPCYFVRAQEATGTDIAGMMVDYLMEKSNRL